MAEWVHPYTSLMNKEQSFDKSITKPVRDR